MNPMRAYPAGRDGFFAPSFAYSAYERPVVVRSFMTTVVQPLVESVVGFTQASSVMPLVNANDALLATVTRAFVPLNDNAFPNTPPTCNAPAIVPLLPLPEKIESAATLPAASLKFTMPSFALNVKLSGPV